MDAVVAPEPRGSRKGRGRPPAGETPASVDEILAAALRVFARDGFTGTSVAAINRELGVSHNLIHQRFGSKEALWYAVADWIFANAVTLLKIRPERADLPPLEEFRLGIVRFLELQAEYPDVVRLISMEAAIESPRLTYLYDRHIQPMSVLLAEPLKPLLQRKILHRDDLRSLHFLIAHGATAPYAALPLATRMSPSDPLGKPAVRRHARLVADTIVAGIEARVARAGGDTGRSP
ncbi:TetR/AcrR family transcriptional regulator [Nocardia sp. NPDC051750]|uniref:TetR/AcrR family transcriptional regulator n=1 Tax=Nocardia sp. NPDC051750 TaxID=3364325 RepID=UPI00378CD387